MAGPLRENDAGIGFRTLGVRTRLLREEGSFTLVVHVDDLLSVGKRKL